MKCITFVDLVIVKLRPQGTHNCCLGHIHHQFALPISYICAQVLSVTVIVAVIRFVVVREKSFFYILPQSCFSGIKSGRRHLPPREEEEKILSTT